MKLRVTFTLLLRSVFLFTYSFAALLRELAKSVIMNVFIVPESLVLFQASISQISFSSHFLLENLFGLVKFYASALNGTQLTNTSCSNKHKVGASLCVCAT